MQVRILRGISLIALLLAVVWFVVAPDFEPVITAILGLGGVLSAGLIDPKRPKDQSAQAPQTTLPVQPESPEQPSVAVLPLLNLSADPEDEFFSDGMTEDVITQLSKIRALKLDRRHQTENVWLFAVGMIHAGLGEKDLAFETLNEAVRERVGWITYLGVEPSVDGLRDDPRFEDLLERIRLPQVREGGP